MIGTILAGKYKVNSLIGSGGMGQVYCCERLDIGDEVAVKVLVQNVNGKDLLNEARAAGTSNHPNICKVFDYFEVNDIGFLVMEKLDGFDLHSLIEQKNHHSDPFSFRLMFSIIRETALALQHAHKNVLHRDIKPANIFLTSQGEIKVLDFGIAKFVNAFSENNNNSFTEAYSSPELWVDGKYDTSKYDASNDIYSLGLVFFELFHLKKAFNSRPQNKSLSLSTDLNKAPEGFEELFSKWTAPRKVDRFRNAAELIAALDLLITDDFNVKMEVEMELSKVLSKMDRNKTLKNNTAADIYAPITSRVDRPWVMVASVFFLIVGALAAELYFNTGKTENSHEEKLSQLKKPQQRGIASPNR